MENQPSIDLNALKTKLRATWMAGDFGQIAISYAAGAEEFVRSLNLEAGMRVLDVACGTGNLSLPAARMGAAVTGVDIAPNLLEQARENAKREGLSVQFDEGDAEKLPYEDASFDAVITMFGAMFAPRPELTAAELKRVCRAGGFVAMANWIPTGFVGQMFKIVGSHVPPPPGVPSPLLWGSEETVRQRLAEGTSDLDMSRRMLRFMYPFSPAQSVDYFRRYYGPAFNAFNALNEDGRAALARDMTELWNTNNEATDDTTNVPAEYLRVVAVRA